MEGQCLGAKLPDTANVAIQIEDIQAHEQHATKQNGLKEKSIRIISKCSLNQEILGSNVPLKRADLDLLATVGPRTVHVYDKLRVVVLSTDSKEIHDSNEIMLMRVLKYTTYYLLSLWHYMQQVTLIRIPHLSKQLFQEFILVKRPLFKHCNLIIQ
ncbi:unnamed protein product [Rotaria socialis]|uniref:Uncharacterized protein n=1 Tax=Rotaria socialis TaxID=392032 RepID=A0A818WKA8_9BILA|nr:unnamed protein product [Rotaria socialis]CAF3726680.1 unnamed protein product [Rotaria socialis]CAF4719163.1 unnamed protein product [Rotaria socialis]